MNLIGVMTILIASFCSNMAMAQAPDPVPNFFDPQHRLEKPDLSSLKVIHFITEDDYPPFDFALPDGTLTGFNVDIARAVCDELQIPCTIQPRRWDTIIDAIQKGESDAAIASIGMNATTRSEVDFTEPYYRTPARFAARKPLTLNDASPEVLAGKTVGVVSHTAHEAYLKTFFKNTTLKSYENEDALRSALRRGEVGIAFDDGVSLAIWLNGTDAAGCCAFFGGPFTESRYFGNGIGIAVRQGNDVLMRALNYALARINGSGVYADIYLKYFPIGFY